MANYSINKLILTINGEQVEAFPVTQNELDSENQKLRENENEELSLACNCGDDFCDSNGYLWICDLGSGNTCNWWRSTWRCNP